MQTWGWVPEKLIKSSNTSLHSLLNLCLPNWHLVYFLQLISRKTETSFQFLPLTLNGASDLYWSPSSGLYIVHLSDLSAADWLNYFVTIRPLFAYFKWSLHHSDISPSINFRISRILLVFSLLITHSVHSSPHAYRSKETRVTNIGYSWLMKKLSSSAQ